MAGLPCTPSATSLPGSCVVARLAASALGDVRGGELLRGERAAAQPKQLVRQLRVQSRKPLLGFANPHASSKI